MQGSVNKNLRRNCQGPRIPVPAGLFHSYRSDWSHTAAIISLLLLLLASIAGAQELQTPLPRPTRVTFSGSGGANFEPVKTQTAGPETELPSSCKSTYTEVGVRVSCESEPSSTAASSCRGSINFYSLNVSEPVLGNVTRNPDGSFKMALHSVDGKIEGCTLTNELPVASDTANAIKMDCMVTREAGCSGETKGAHAGEVLTSAGTVTIEPTD